jgi:hypothetical protein
MDTALWLHMAINGLHRCFLILNTNALFSFGCRNLNDI